MKNLEKLLPTISGCLLNSYKLDKYVEEMLLPTISGCLQQYLVLFFTNSPTL